MRIFNDSLHSIQTFGSILISKIDNTRNLGNRIYAGTGNDTIIVGANDIIKGQDGNDRFFTQTGEVAQGHQFGDRQLTIDLISQHLATSSFLTQVLREIVVDEILADSQIQIDRAEVEITCDRLAQSPIY